MRASLRAFTAAAVATGVLAAAGTASAAAPTGEWSYFKGCPYQNTAVQSCLYSVSTSGAFQFGKANVPVSKPITFQGGFTVDPETAATTWYGSGNGQPVLSKTPLPVPGGLLGLMDTGSFGGPLLQAFNKAVQTANGVTATAELVGPADFNYLNFLISEGTAITLPVRVKLDNPFLGPNCYIGSKSSPVNLKLTTGTTAPPAPNKPITGSSGTVTTNDEGTLVFINGLKLVDNTFSVPKATGCGYLPLDQLLITGAVNAKEGLPSAAGRNSAVLSGNAKQADANALRASVR